MACGICLEEDVDVINIFNEEGARLKISSIIQQHFWFEPRESDPILSQICISCWEQIANFHIFYTAVKEAHKKLEENYYTRRVSDEDQIYTIEDSDDEEEMQNDFAEDGSKENDASDISEGDKQFFRQEHENLLEQYTYVEATRKDTFDNNETSGMAYFQERSARILKAGQERSFEDMFEWNKSSSKGDGYESSRGYSKSRPNYQEEEERIKAEDTLIAKHISLECDRCFVKLDTFNELSRHYQAAHNVSGYVRCCDKKLPSRSYILDHINQHINPESYKCRECNKAFSTQYAIKNHLAMKHAPESLKIFKCKDCPKRFTNDYSLNKHLLEHKNDDEKRLYCTDCRKMFSSSKALETHRSIHHKRISGHICHVCGIILKSKKAFGKHIKEHAALLGPDAIKDPVCPICGKLSASIKTLRHHIRYVHTTMRPHKCTICGKGFKIRQKLKEHMGTHAVGLSLPCPYCPKRFRSKIHVYSHKYRMHRKEYDKERHTRFETGPDGTYEHFELTNDE